MVVAVGSLGASLAGRGGGHRWSELRAHVWVYGFGSSHRGELQAHRAGLKSLLRDMRLKSKVTGVRPGLVPLLGGDAWTRSLTGVSLEAA